MGIDARVVTEITELATHRHGWDRLAVEAALPYCSPAWQESWWRACAPANAKLRVVAVTEDDVLIGILPLYEEATPTHTRVWRQLCAGFTTRVRPLVKQGRESEVAAAAARVLARPDGPELLSFEGLPTDRAWPELLREHWPTTPRPAVHRDRSMETPVADLGGGYDAWLARRGKTVHRMTSRMRALGRRGLTIRVATPSEQGHAIDTLCRLYAERWGLGRASLATAAMLREAAQELGDRFRLFLLDTPAETVAAYLVVGAGDELAAWGGGFDARWGRLSPVSLLRLAAIEDATRCGYERLEFGEGVQLHKLRYADRTVPVEWATLIPRTRRYPIVRAWLLPKHARAHALAAARRLPEPMQRGLRQLRRTPRE